jgi:hypothetical protein
VASSQQLQLTFSRMEKMGAISHDEQLVLIALCSHKKGHILAATIAQAQRMATTSKQVTMTPEGPSPSRPMTAGEHSATLKSSLNRAVASNSGVALLRPQTADTNTHIRTHTDTHTLETSSLKRRQQGTAELLSMEPETWEELQQVAAVWPSIRRVPEAIYNEGLAKVEREERMSRGGSFKSGSSSVLKPGGEWCMWVSSKTPELREVPAVPHPHGDQKPCMPLRQCDRLLLIAVLRPDRLSTALDQLVEQVLGSTFLQVVSDHRVESNQLMSDTVLRELAELDLPPCPLRPLLVQVSADDPVDCTALLVNACKEVRTRLVLRDVSTSATNSVPQQMAPANSGAAGTHNCAGNEQSRIWEQHFESLLNEAAVLTKQSAEADSTQPDSNVWLVLKCSPLTPETAEMISELIACLTFLGSASSRSPSSASRETEILPGESHHNYSAMPASSHATTANGSRGGGRAATLKIWVLVDNLKLIPIQTRRSCVHICSSNIMCRSLGGGGIVAVSHIAAELFHQLINNEEILQRMGKAVSLEDEQWRALASLSVMHAVLVERRRFKGGWSKHNDIFFEDFVSAVCCLRRALNVYERRRQLIDWRLVRCLVALQYASLEMSPWDARVLQSSLDKHLHQGILNSRYEVLPGLSLSPPSSRSGFFMSSIVKSMRQNAHRDRIEITGLNRTTADAQALSQDQLLAAALFDRLNSTRAQSHTESQFGVSCLHLHPIILAFSQHLFHPASHVAKLLHPHGAAHEVSAIADAILSLGKHRTMQAPETKEPSGNTGLTLEKQAKIAPLVATNKLKGFDKDEAVKAQHGAPPKEGVEKRHPVIADHPQTAAAKGLSSLMMAGRHPNSPVKRKTGLKNRAQSEQAQQEEGGLGLTPREQRLVAVLRSLDDALPQASLCMCVCVCVCDCEFVRACAR